MNHFYNCFVVDTNPDFMTAMMSFKCEPLLISLSHLVKVTINNKSVEPYDLCDVGIT